MPALHVRIGAAANDHGCPVFARHGDQPEARIGTIPGPDDEGRDAIGTVAREVLMSRYDGATHPAEMGRRLHALLSAGGVITRWKAAEEASGLALIVEEPGLAGLPWELLGDDAGWYPFQRSERPWWRQHAATQLSRAEITPPIKLLIVLADSQDDEIKAEDEIDAVIGALRAHPGQWHIECLTDPSADDLFERLQMLEPHVLHIIGHGELDTDPPGDPVIWMRDGRTRTAWKLTTMDVSNIESPTPRLVVLNACRTASAAEQASVHSHATAWLRSGVAAVLSMQGDITGDAAATLADELYTKLAAGTDIAHALAKARSRLTRAPHDRRQWALPSLTLQVEPDQVLRTRDDVAAEWNVESRRRFGSVTDLVDRAELRREVWRAVDPHLKVEPTPRILLVQGELDVGRRAAVRSALLVPYLHGRRVVVSKLPSRAVSFEDAMRRVRDDIQDQVHEPASGACDLFSHKLAWLVDGMEPPPRSIGPVRDDADSAPFNPRNENFDRAVRATFTAFAELLVAVAADSGLLLVIDRPSAVTPKYLEEYVVPHFVEQVANGGLPGVQLLLIDTSAQFSEPVWDAVVPHARRLDVPYFPAGELRRLVREFGVRRGLDNVDSLERLLVEVTQGSPRWSPVALPRLQALASEFGPKEAR